MEIACHLPWRLLGYPAMKLFLAALLTTSVALAAGERSQDAVAAESAATLPGKIADFTLNDHAGAKRSHRPVGAGAQGS